MIACENVHLLQAEHESQGLTADWLKNSVNLNSSAMPCEKSMTPALLSNVHLIVLVSVCIVVYPGNDVFRS